MSMFVCLSVDVEEEGLFSGRYAARAEGLRNVARLERLAFVSEEFGVPLTLLGTWPVYSDAGCAAILRRWQDARGAELGCHLHPWNTPPLDDPAAQAWTPSEAMPEELLDAKLAALAAACAQVSGHAPTSFRMGRFDLGPKVLGLLPRHGLRVDSSIVPCCFCAARPQSFLSPCDPYPLAEGLWEVPLTMQPLSHGLRALAWRAAGMLGPGAGTALLRRFHVLGAAGTMPVWQPLASIKLGARLHLARGGRVVQLFLHSSELMPGGSPELPDEAAVERLVARIRAFLLWLREHARERGGLRGGGLRGVTLGQLPGLLSPGQGDRA